MDLAVRRAERMSLEKENALGLMIACICLMEIRASKNPSGSSKRGKSPDNLKLLVSIRNGKYKDDDDEAEGGNPS